MPNATGVAAYNISSSSSRAIGNVWRAASTFDNDRKDSADFPDTVLNFLNPVPISRASYDTPEEGIVLVRPILWDSPLITVTFQILLLLFFQLRRQGWSEWRHPDGWPCRPKVLITVTRLRIFCSLQSASIPLILPRSSLKMFNLQYKRATDYSVQRCGNGGDPMLARYRPRSREVHFSPGWPSCCTAIQIPTTPIRHSRTRLFLMNNT